MSSVSPPVRWRDDKGIDHFHAKPGSDIRISFPKASLPPEAINEFYTVVDFIESKWIEFDSHLRDRATGGTAT